MGVGHLKEAAISLCQPLLFAKSVSRQRKQKPPQSRASQKGHSASTVTAPSMMPPFNTSEDWVQVVPLNAPNSSV
jgi:hypothetical protein